MPDLFLLCEKVADECNMLQDKIALKEWADMAPIAFAYNLKYAINGLEETASWLQLIEEELKKGHLAGTIDVKEVLGKFNKELVVLKQNLKMEEGRAKRIEHGRLDDEITRPAEELYSSLESKALALILETRFLMDRLNVQLRKESATSTPKDSYKHVLKLLDDKEKELHELRKKVSELKEMQVFGGIGVKDTIEIEKELYELGDKIEKKGHDDEIKEFVKKSKSLIGTLKKERDFASKIALGMENEIAQMRSMYSKELLSIGEVKKQAFDEAERNAERKSEKLKEELAKTGESLNHYKHLIYERDMKIAELKEHTHHVVRHGTSLFAHLGKKDSHRKGL